MLGRVREMDEVVVKLPWISDARREVEAQRWAERSFPGAPPECAARVAVIFAERLSNDLEHLPADRPLNEVPEFNELALVELMMALEKEFGFSISNEDATVMTTPGAIVGYVQKRTEGNLKA